MVVCVDTSLLFSLYGNDVHSQRAITWVRSGKRPLTLSGFNEYELANALRFAEFRQVIAPGMAARCWSQFVADQAAGRLVVAVPNLATVLTEARRLSATYTLTGGHRAFDILHIATALQLGAGDFLTFEDNQKRLALAVGLHVPR